MQPTEEVLRELLDASPDAVLATDTDGRVVYANQQVSLLFGWPAGDLLGQPIGLDPGALGRSPRSCAGPREEAATRYGHRSASSWARRVTARFPAAAGDSRETCKHVDGRRGT